MPDQTNPFDQFDQPSTNAFDQFDAPAAKPAGVGRKAADLGLSVVKGMVAVPEAAVGVADLVTGGAAGKAVEGLGVRFKDAKDALTELQSDDLKGKQRQFQEADGILPKVGVALSNPSLIANTVMVDLLQPVTSELEWQRYNDTIDGLWSLASASELPGNALEPASIS